MIEEKAEIIELGSDYFWARTQRESACQSCSSQDGCGQSALNKWSDKLSHRFKVKYHGEPLKVGDQVMVGVEEGMVLTASLWTYGMPLIGLILFAMFASFMNLPESYTILTSLLGGLVGFYFVHQKDKKMGKNKESLLTPVFLRKISE